MAEATRARRPLRRRRLRQGATPDALDATPAAIAASQTVHITGLTYGPHGVGRLPNGKAVLVRGVLPGEEVEVRVREDHAAFAFAEATRIVTPSGHRRVPPCVYLPRCGGCPWQHIDYATQLAAKEQNVRDQLARHAHLPAVEVRPILGSPDELGCRSRLSLRVAGGGIGFYAAGSHELVPIERCLLGSDELNAVLPAVAAFCAALRSVLRRIELVARGAQPGNVLLGEIEGPLAGADAEIVRQLLRDEPRIAGVVLAGRRWRRSWGDEWVGIAPEPDLSLRARAGGFTQVNPSANRLLVSSVLADAALTPSDTVLDLFAGVGNLTVPIARRSRRVIAVEQSPLAAEDARANAAALGLAHCEIRTLSAQRAVAAAVAAQERYDVIVLDPPRSGAAEVIDGLLALAAPRLVYVSCNPATLARDARRLAQRYRIASAQPIDLFPQSYHVETVLNAVLTC